MGRHLPYVITQCYLPPSYSAKASKPVIDLPTPEGWKAELTEATWQCTGRKSNSKIISPTP